MHIYLDHRSVDADGPLAKSWVSRELDRGAYGFQVHHADPLSFVRGVKLTSQSGQLQILALGTFPLAFVTVLVPYNCIRITLYTMTILASSSQVVHAFAHLKRSRVPRAVRWAQDHGLLISRLAHARHHAGHNADFAIVNGWCNPVVNLLWNVHVLRSGSSRMGTSTKHIGRP